MQSVLMNSNRSGRGRQLVDSSRICFILANCQWVVVLSALQAEYYTMPFNRACPQLLKGMQACMHALYLKNQSFPAV